MGDEEDEEEVEDTSICEGRLIVDIELVRYKLMNLLAVEFEDGTPSDALLGGRCKKIFCQN